ncbi:MAG: hypothetical protein FWD57_03005, partial [Polyangiaceae bacterium]|nr:hypothetical protein [Polyangiaceae bacterium]
RRRARSVLAMAVGARTRGNDRLDRGDGKVSRGLLCHDAGPLSLLGPTLASVEEGSAAVATGDRATT